MTKSYWLGMVVDNPAAQQAVKSWLMGLVDGMTCESADVLCDAETDREKKLRAVMVDAKGKRRLFTRTMGMRFTVTSKHLGPAVSVGVRP